MTDFQLCQKLFCFEQKGQDHFTINIEVEMWDQIKTQIMKRKIQIIKTQDNETIYLNDEIILRVQSIQDALINPQNFTNLEQIQNLQWKKENEINIMKIVKSRAFWNGEVFKGVGGYFLDGQKQGFWREIIDNYWSQAEVYVIGEYNKNKKVGWPWIIQLLRLKNRKVDIVERQIFEVKITVNILVEVKLHILVNIKMVKRLDYGKFGIRIMKQKEINKLVVDHMIRQIQLKLVGGLKTVIILGIVHKLFIKVNIKMVKRLVDGIFYIEINRVKHFNRSQFSGGGSYDDQVQGDLIKIGSWIEISEEFYKWSQVTYQGEYKDGKRIGKWEIWFKDCHKNQKKLIGGGFYDDKSSTKIGKWIEQNLRFYYNSQVTWTRQYKNGQKVGRWDIVHEEQQIGGGQYKEDGNSETKIGNWIELSHSFRDWSQITYNGEYKEDRKVGRWDIWYKDWETKKMNNWGGHYDEISSIKNGVWIELSDIFDRYSQVIYD